MDEYVSKDNEFLKEARERATDAAKRWSDCYAEAHTDRELVAGKQWSEEDRQLRLKKRQITMTFNRLSAFCHQVLNDQRQNRAAINVNPVEADNPDKKLSNLAGNKDYTLAEIYESLIRNIEYTSGAEWHYDRAFKDAVVGGFGFLRVLYDYSSSNSFNMDIKISSVISPFSVLIDPNFTEPDASDMGYAYVDEYMDKKEFERKYPEARRGDLDDLSEYNEWIKDDQIKVSEYFTREQEERTILKMSNGSIYDKEDAKPMLAEMEANGITVQDERKHKTWKVKWYKITAWSILEGPVEVPCQYIPIVPIFGNETRIDGEIIYESLVRHARDAQKQYNYWKVAATEAVANSPKAPWIGDSRAFEGFKRLWATSNEVNHGFLPYNSEGGTIAPPQRTQVDPQPAAQISQAISANEDIKATIGMFEASLGQRSNEKSGKAILARQKEGDTATFHFADNLHRSIQFLGKIIVNMIPKVYTTERIVRIRFPNSENDWVAINQRSHNPRTGSWDIVHDLGATQFDVQVKAGPSYSTMRQEAATNMIELVRAMPNVGQVIADQIFANMDFPGAAEIAERLKKTLPQGLVENNDEPDPAQMAQQQAMQAQAQAMMQAQEVKMQTEGMKAEADQMKAQAAMIKAQADAQKAQFDDATLARVIQDTVMQTLAGLQNPTKP